MQTIEMTRIINLHLSSIEFLPELQPGHVFEACGPVDIFEGNKIMLKE